VSGVQGVVHSGRVECGLRNGVFELQATNDPGAEVEPGAGVEASSDGVDCDRGDCPFRSVV
jgi:hypothetical protein